MSSFWRVENSEGEGPYTCSLLNDFLLYKHNKCPNHPVDSELNTECDMNNSMIFGFPTLQAAKDWFSEEEFECMAQHGYTLKQVAGKNEIVSMDGKQLVFERV